MSASTEPAYTIFSSDYLKDFTTKVFLHFGIPEEDAIQAAVRAAR